MSQFYVGDRVYLKDNYTADWGDTKAGDTGTVCYVRDGSTNVGVCFDRWVGGHYCEGTCEDGYGFYISSFDLGLIEQETDPVQFPDLGLLSKL